MPDSEAMLESELRIQLRPVAAPASLWESIQDRLSRPRRRHRQWFGLMLLPAAAIMLLTLSPGFGLRTIRLFGTPVATVAYRAGGNTAALLVSREVNATSHPIAHGTVFAWSAPVRLYALALPEACVLCHTGPTAAARP